MDRHFKYNCKGGKYSVIVKHKYESVHTIIDRLMYYVTTKDGDLISTNGKTLLDLGEEYTTFEDGIYVSHFIVDLEPYKQYGDDISLVLVFPFDYTNNYVFWNVEYLGSKKK